jgi:restriction system protein
MAERMPIYHELLWPTLRAVRDLGGSATISEIDERVIESEGFTEEQQATPHGNGRQSEIEYRLAWARTNLKGIGAIVNSARGVWAVTEAGQSLDEDSVLLADKEWRVALAAERRAREAVVAAEREDEGTDEEGADEGWKDRVISALLEMPPDGFERLAQRLLREAGFSNVVVTGRSGDGGIDGAGLYRPTLVSFPVFFQCKRYKGSVGPRDVRDFRGAMAGRGEKGMLITTGSFTRDAQQEATRDGAPAVELIDGDRLCDLLKEYGLGITVTERVVEDVTVEPTFFAGI